MATNAPRVLTVGQTAPDFTLPSHPERFFSNRAYFLIDKSGVIRWVHVEETPGQRRENVEILAEIAKLS